MIVATSGFPHLYYIRSQQKCQIHFDGKCPGKTFCAFAGAFCDPGICREIAPQGALPRASRSGRHVGLRTPRNDKLENFTPQNVCRKDCQPAWRSLSAATDAIGAYRFNGGRYGLHVQRRARLSAPLHRTAEGLRIIHSSVFIFHMPLLFPCRFTDSRHSAACLPGRRAGFPR